MTSVPDPQRTRAEAPRFGRVAILTFAALAGLVAALVAAVLIAGAIRQATDTDQLRGIKADPMTDYAPPGYTRVTRQVKDDHHGYCGDNCDIEDPRVFVRSTYERRAAGAAPVKQAIADAATAAAGYGFREIASTPTDGYTGWKLVGKRWHSFTAPDGTKGYNKIQGDLVIEPAGRDRLVIAVEYNGTVRDADQ